MAVWSEFFYNICNFIQKIKILKILLMEENTPIGQQQVSLDQVVASSMIQTAFRKYRERKKLQKDIGKIGELDSDKNVIEKVDEEEMNKEVQLTR